jgi:CRISPR-associated protein Csb1
MDEIKNLKELNLADLVETDGPVCLVVKAKLAPVGDLDRFQPAGFPEIGHVLYKAPRPDGGIDDVCIVDSAASMANHLETVCFDSPNSTELHPDLDGMPYVVCVTDRDYKIGDPLKEGTTRNRRVCTSLTEGHRIASDYFLDGLMNPTWAAAAIKKEGKGEKKKDVKVAAHWEGKTFREKLREDFKIEQNFVYPDNWWDIYRSIFKYDPNSLVHGVLFAKQQIKVSRILTAHCEASGAKRVGRSGVKFDRLGKTTSGQPIFAVDEEVADEIRATFIVDLALLRSYGNSKDGLKHDEKLFLLKLALWKVGRLLQKPFRYRSGCHLRTITTTISTDETEYKPRLPELGLKEAISKCGFPEEAVTELYYPATHLFKQGQDSQEEAATEQDEEASEE